MESAIGTIHQRSTNSARTKINIFDFVGPQVSVTTTQNCCIAQNNQRQYTNKKLECVPIEFFFFLIITEGVDSFPSCKMGRCWGSELAEGSVAGPKTKAPISHPEALLQRTPGSWGNMREARQIQLSCRDCIKGRVGRSVGS